MTEEFQNVRVMEDFKLKNGSVWYFLTKVSLLSMSPQCKVNSINLTSSKDETFHFKYANVCIFNLTKHHGKIYCIYLFVCLFTLIVFNPYSTGVSYLKKKVC